jgi:hypothetical protein
VSDLAKFSDIEDRIPSTAQTQGGAFSAGSVDVRGILRADLKECSKSREHVAMELSDSTGARITLDMIDAMVAPTKAHRFPAEWIPAWVSVTGSRRILDALCGAAGLWVATGEDQEFAELGRTKLRAEKLERKLWARC